MTYSACAIASNQLLTSENRLASLNDTICKPLLLSVLRMVEVDGLEPTTSCLQSRCSSS